MAMSLLEEPALIEFINSISSEKTKLVYGYYLTKYMQYLEANSYTSLLTTDTKYAESKIIEFILHRKKLGISYSTLNQIFSAIKLFYRINDIELNWFKISKFLGENKKIVNDRAYTTEEISKLIQIATLRDRIIILLMSSTGIRVGSITDINIGDLHYNEKNNIHQIVVYKNTKDEYFVFCTPECSAAIMEYVQFRQRMGEQITEKSPLIRKHFDIKDGLKVRYKKNDRITTNAIEVMLAKLLDITGISPIEHKFETSKPKEIRKKIMRSHGFRKFWMRQVINSKITLK